MLTDVSSVRFRSTCSAVIGCMRRIVQTRFDRRDRVKATQLLARMYIAWRSCLWRSVHTVLLLSGAALCRCQFRASRTLLRETVRRPIVFAVCGSLQMTNRTVSRMLSVSALDFAPETKTLLRPDYNRLFYLVPCPRIHSGTHPLRFLVSS